MEKINFPAWKYHATEEARIVQDQAEADALGPDWFDTPDLKNDDPDALYVVAQNGAANLTKEHVSYPSWRYHPSEPPRIVQDETEDAALGEGWYDHPNCNPMDRDGNGETGGSKPDEPVALKGMAKAKLLETATNEFGEDFANSISAMTNPLMIAAIEAKRLAPPEPEAEPETETEADKQEDAADLL